jgi:RNA polymerase sigma-70 factor (ECF subfamily)
MPDDDRLTIEFDEHRAHLWRVAYRLLGSRSEADDAVQETWLRLSRADTSDVANLGGWLTTVVGRICLDVLRHRESRREDPLEVRVPDPVVVYEDETNPEREALLAESVGLALLVVLEQLQPAERLAFVLHDVFAVPFDEIAGMLDRTPEAARQLASRARRRVQGTAPAPDADLAGQRRVVDAFLAAARDGDFEALVSVLDPDIVLRSDGGLRNPEATVLVRGAENVGRRAYSFRTNAEWVRRAVVNGAPGFVVAPEGRIFAVLSFTVRGGRIAEIDVLADPDRLEALGL